MRSTTQSGLTLIEVLIVLMILGVLVGLTSLGVSLFMDQATTLSASAELDQVQKAIWAHLLTGDEGSIAAANCVTDLGSCDPVLWPGYMGRRYPGQGRAYSWDSDGNVWACEDGSSGAVGSYYPNRNLAGEPLVVRTDDTIDFDWGYGVPAEGMPSDQFSVHWELTMQAREAGIYRFTTRTDDGVRVTVDGVVVIDAWRYMSATVYQGDITLAAGPHQVVMDYFEGNGNAIAQLDWAYLGSEELGWTVSYYASRTLSGLPVLTRSVSAFDFEYAGISPGEDVPVSNWSGIWSAPLVLDESHIYRFTAAADGGMQVTVDGFTVINAWSGSGLDGNALYADLSLLAGAHVIEVRYWHRSGDAYASLSWEPSETEADAWMGSYYANDSLSGEPLYQRLDPAINFDWGTASPGGSLPNEHFSVRWTKTATFEAGDYAFTATADDGIRVKVDGTAVIDEWHNQSATTYHEDVTLSAGEHALVVEFYDNTVDAVAQVNWARLP